MHELNISKQVSAAKLVIIQGVDAQTNMFNPI